VLAEKTTLNASDRGTSRQTYLRITKRQHNNPCHYCGSLHAKAKCPTYGETFKTCGNETILPVFEKQRQHKPQLNFVEEDIQSVEQADAMWYITHVNCMQANQSKRFINLRLTPHNVKSFNDNSHYSLQFQIDTWLHNVICLRDLQHLLQDGNPVLMLSKAILKLYKGTIIKPKGECDLKADNKGHIYTLRFQVMEPSHIPLLSVETCQKLNLLPINTNHVIHNIDTKEVSGASHAMDEIISVYDDVFDRLGCLPGELHLEIDPTVQPVQLLPRRIPIPIKSTIIKAIQEMEQKGVMAKVVELTPWIINMVVTEKKMTSCAYAFILPHYVSIQPP